MSHQQFHETVQQWAELEREGQDEIEARKREDVEEAWRESLATRYPILRAWPQKEKA